VKSGPFPTLRLLSQEPWGWLIFNEGRHRIRQKVQGPFALFGAGADNRVHGFKELSPISRFDPKANLAIDDSFWLYFDNFIGSDGHLPVYVTEPGFWFFLP